LNHEFQEVVELSNRHTAAGHVRTGVARAQRYGEHVCWCPDPWVHPSQVCTDAMSAREGHHISPLCTKYHLFDTSYRSRSRRRRLVQKLWHETMGLPPSSGHISTGNLKSQQVAARCVIPRRETEQDGRGPRAKLFRSCRSSAARPRRPIRDGRPAWSVRCLSGMYEDRTIGKETQRCLSGRSMARTRGAPCASRAG